MARYLNILAFVLLCTLPVILSIKFYRYGYCYKCSPCANIPTNGLVDDWALLVATAPAADNSLTYWGPTFVGCDTNTIQGTCSNQGIYYLSGDDNGISTGFQYGYNVQLEKWTLESFVVNKLTIPGTNFTGYETFSTEYVTVEDGAIFQGGKPVACATQITINPMLRRSRWVLLETDQNQNYRIVMHCENIDGFLYNGYPQINIYVKRSVLNQYLVTDCKKLAFYDTIVKALTRNNINVDAITWQIIQQDKPCPTDVVYNSIKWENCKCQISGTATSFQTAVRGYY